MARIHLLTGGERSGREREIDNLAAERWGRALLIVPARREANERAARIVQAFKLPGAWDACVLSFEDFVLRILRDAGVFPHELDEVERRALIESALDRLRASNALSDLGDAASSPGFASHVLRVITKLKQAAIDPPAFREAISLRSRTSWLDPIVADVYETYQEILRSTDAYDRVGVYWRAHELLGVGTLRLFNRVRHVLFDGFDDFTPSEFRVIEVVSRIVDTLTFGLACDADSPSTRDLYAVPLQTHDHLRRVFPDMQSRSFPDPAPKSRVDYVASNLFWRDKPDEVPAIDENLTLCACHDRTHECEWIGRRIKSLVLDHGASPGRIAVVYRRLDDVASRLRVVFREFEIPATFHQPRTLAQSSFIRFLLRLLEVPPLWERESVLDVLGSVWAGGAREYAHAYAFLARAAGVIEGRREWHSCLQRLRSWLTDGAGEERDAILRRVPNALSALDELRGQLAALDERLRVLPAKATRATFSDAMLAFVHVLWATHAIERIENGDAQAFEERAFAALVAVLRRMRAWESQSGGRIPVTLASYVSDIGVAFESSAVDEDDGANGVEVMSAETARFREYDYLFLAGLNEGEFPAPPATDAVYSDEDWADLEKAGVRAEHRSRQMDREMLLLHHVLGRARIHATVTWCATGHDGRPMAPSPFVDDIRELLGAAGESIPRSTSFLPRPEEVSSGRDLRGALDVPREVEAAFAHAFARMQSGLGVERERNSPRAFGAYDGVLCDSTLTEQLSEKYGHGHAFSAAQLEAYAECPFRFFLERVLRVEQDAAPDEDFDPRTRGRILHEVLFRFHRQYAGLPVGEIPERDARESMTRVCGDVFDHHARREVTAPRGVVRVERARMEAQLLRYLDLARQEEELWAPKEFEKAFGQAHGPGDGEEIGPFALDTDAGAVLLSGRIDRIDKLGDEARIVDYKTTIRHSVKDVLAGVSLQLPLYAVALETHVMPGTHCAEAVLIQPGKADKKEVLQKDAGKWPEREAGMRAGIARAITGIRAGAFPPDPHDKRCHVCAMSRVCRFEQWRIERKKRDDGAAND